MKGRAITNAQSIPAALPVVYRLMGRRCRRPVTAGIIDPLVVAGDVASGEVFSQRIKEDAADEYPYSC